ncbi:MAG: hypothetical protein KBE27_05920 [Syntrophorhabdaceae bacterium]|nr:hypothetical protein [Syntrophorhabdaceae bacterium]
MQKTSTGLGLKDPPVCFFISSMASKCTRDAMYGLFSAIAQHYATCNILEPGGIS